MVSELAMRLLAVAQGLERLDRAEIEIHLPPLAAAMEDMLKTPLEPEEERAIRGALERINAVWNVRDRWDNPNG